ncbi:hypothetical protein LINGRAHAP2_LOCUS13002 [Linum grandiflorum]
MATASSGFTLLLASFPSNISFNISLTFGILVLPPTRTISLISVLFTLPSSNVFVTVSNVFLNKSIFNFSNFALVSSSEKSFPPSKKYSISTFTSLWLLRLLFALSHSFRSFPNALAFPLMSLPYFSFINWTK